MIVIRSMIAVAQAVFIPGFLGMKLARNRTGSLLETLTLSCALSLIINYTVVSWTVLVGIDHRVAIAVYAAAEVGVALFLLAKWLRAPDRPAPLLRLPVSPPSSWPVAFIFIVAFATISGAVVAAVRRIGTFPVFTAWDAVFSWNHWAYEWYAGIFPSGTMSYPQLVPANWSLIYRVAGSPELQFLGLILPLVLGLAILFMFYDLGLRKRRAEYLIAIPLCVAAVPAIHNGLLFEGLADVPVAFAAFAVFYALELRSERLIRDWRGLGLPWTLACGAAMTKLNGGYALLIVLILALVGHIGSGSRLSMRSWGRSAATALGLLLVICGPWFGQKALEVVRTRALLNAEDLVNSAGQVAGSSGTVAKLLVAGQMFPFGWYSVAAAAFVIGACLLIPRTRWVAVAVVVPYTFLWAIYLGVSLRNWVIMLPFAAYLTAFAIGLVLERVFRVDLSLGSASVREWRVPAVVATGALVVFVVVVMVTATVFPDQRLLAGQIYRQRQVGHVPLNEMVYSVLEQRPEMHGEILSDYWYLSVLPGFRWDSFRLDRSNGIHVSIPWYAEVTPKMLASRGLSYVLLSNYIPESSQAYVDARIADGSFTVLGTYRSEEPFIPYFEGRPVEVRFIKVNGPGSVPADGS